MATKPHQAAAGSQKPTPDQRRARKEMSLLSEAWNSIEEDERRAWDDKSSRNRRGGRAARRRRRSGRRLFFQANFHQLALQQKLLTHPNAADRFHVMPQVELIITNHAGRISLMLRLLQGDFEGVMLSSWPPLNAGVMVWRRFVRLGPLPAPRRGLIDITKLYVDKFGIPPVGKKIFIRIQQMKDTLGKLYQVTSAIVRPEQGWD
jgi:hypothetical protein